MDSREVMPGSGKMPTKLRLRSSFLRLVISPPPDPDPPPPKMMFSRDVLRMMSSVTSSGHKPRDLQTIQYNLVLSYLQKYTNLYLLSPEEGAIHVTVVEVAVEDSQRPHAAALRQLLLNSLQKNSLQDK